VGNYPPNEWHQLLAKEKKKVWGKHAATKAFRNKNLTVCTCAECAFETLLSKVCHKQKSICLLQVVNMSMELALLYVFLCNYGIVRRSMGTDLQFSLLTLRMLVISKETSVAPKLQINKWIQQKESFV
jgi:hypothetical protein